MLARITIETTSRLQYVKEHNKTLLITDANRIW